MGQSTLTHKESHHRNKNLKKKTVKWKFSQTQENWKNLKHLGPATIANIKDSPSPWNLTLRAYLPQFVLHNTSHFVTTKNYKACVKVRKKQSEEMKQALELDSNMVHMLKWSGMEFKITMINLSRGQIEKVENMQV